MTDLTRVTEFPYFVLKACYTVTVARVGQHKNLDNVAIFSKAGRVAVVGTNSATACVVKYQDLTAPEGMYLLTPGDISIIENLSRSGHVKGRASYLVRLFRDTDGFTLIDDVHRILTEYNNSIFNPDKHPYPTNLHTSMLRDVERDCTSKHDALGFNFGPRFLGDAIKAAKCVSENLTLHMPSDQNKPLLITGETYDRETLYTMSVFTMPQRTAKR